MYNFQDYIDAVHGNSGYCVGHLTIADLEVFQNLVSSQYQQIMRRHESAFSEKNFDITAYHMSKITNSPRHKKIWPKDNRILTQNRLEEIKKTEFFADLDKQFDWHEITDEENVGWGEVYFRLCRPSPHVDVGPLHADAWFWDLGHGKMPSADFDTERVKFWFCLHARGGRTGFRYVEGSHKKSYNFGGEQRDGFVKPTFDESKYELDVHSLKGGAGTFIVFNDQLLHSGEVLTSGTRVSLEFTLVIERPAHYRY